MKVKQINVSKGFTISVGKFESVRLDSAVTVDVEEEEDDIDVVFEKAYGVVSQQIMGQVMLMKSVIDRGSFIHDLSEGETKRVLSKGTSRRRA